ncbi:MAG: hypothetical protein ACKVP4_01025 [Hyphomicrobium sp.]
MTRMYDEDDRANALPNHLPLIGADIEINANVSGDDLVVRVNKGGVQVCRVLLRNAVAALTSDQLFKFSAVSPDFVFNIGDTADGITRLKRAISLA